VAGLGLALRHSLDAAFQRRQMIGPQKA
jgi:hypothetical protein